MDGLWFIIGNVVGGLISFVIMSFMYYNRSSEYEDEIRQLREQIDKKGK